MKQWIAAATLALFGLAPAAAWACEYDDSSASATPPTQLGVAPPPAASKAPAAKFAKAPVAKSKQALGNKVPARDAKLAAVSTN